MALFKHKTKEEIRERYNCYALLFLVPIYLKLDFDEETMPYLSMGEETGFMPIMDEMNWVPKPLFWVASGMMGAWLGVKGALKQEPDFPLVIIKYIES